MTIKGADWDSRLARALITPKGSRLRTLREAAALVVEQDSKRQVGRSAAQALMVASMRPEALEGATEAVEKAISELAAPRTNRPQKEIAPPSFAGRRGYRGKK